MKIDKVLIGQRIEAALTGAGLKKKDLATALGVSPASVSGYCAGTTEPSLSSLATIAEVCGVNLEQLILGKTHEVPATITREEALREALKQALAGDDHLVREAQADYAPANDKERRLLTAFRQLSERRQDRLIEDAEEGVFVLQQSRRRGERGGNLPESNCA